ncbi:MAG TPA: hypothetical protein VGE52_21415 [Pirellulales bacterium]
MSGSLPPPRSGLPPRRSGLLLAAWVAMALFGAALLAVAAYAIWDRTRATPPATSEVEATPPSATVVAAPPAQIETTTERLAAAKALVEQRSAEHRATLDKLQLMKIEESRLDMVDLAEGKRAPAVVARFTNGLDKPIGAIAGSVEIVAAAEAAPGADPARSGRTEKTAFVYALDAPLRPDGKTFLTIPLGEGAADWAVAPRSEPRVTLTRVLASDGAPIVDVETTLKPLEAAQRAVESPATP